MAVQKDNMHRGMRVVQRGLPLDDAKGAMILIHGRGASPMDILTLAHEIDTLDPNEAKLAYLAPEAARRTWYPTTFLAPFEQNEPWLSSALAAVDDLVQRVLNAGIPREKLIIGGFSQGACLSSEYVARNPGRYGGVAVLSGGLIGPPGTPRDYAGSLEGTPIFLGCSDIDMHIPLERVKESTEVLKKMGADVTEKIYPGMGHTVNLEELEYVKQMVDNITSS